MPDDHNAVAILYGPTLLAFVSSEEIILKAEPTDILKNLSKSEEDGTFHLTHNGTTYTPQTIEKINPTGYMLPQEPIE